MKKTFFKKIPLLFLLLIFFYFAYLLRPIFTNQVKGTLSVHKVPSEYIDLANFLYKQPQFFRTLWIPTIQRFGFNSYTHPALDASAFFNTSNAINLLKNKKSEQLLQEASIKYIIVPYDSEGEIFLRDRKYNNLAYLQTVNEVAQIPYIKKLSDFNKDVVFEVPNPKDHFFLLENIGTIAYSFINPVSYRIEVKNVTKGEKLIFSESYDASWKLRTTNNEIASKPFNKYFNSFSLPASGSYTAIITYSSQKWIYIGLSISILSLLVICSIILIISYKWYRKGKSGKIGQ